MEGDIFIDELNDEQREAVLYTDGPSLVIAGAGAGKTRVLTYKIAYLLMQGLAPWNILALTFTNKAAKEMQERIAAQVGTDLAGRLWMGTFHSIFARILRMEAEHIGFSSHFTIYDQADSRSLIKAIIKEMKLDDKKYRPNHIAAQISNAKNRLVWPEAYLSNAAVRRADDNAQIPLTGEIYKRYMMRCQQADALDFDDLLLYTHKLLTTCPDICNHYAERFQFVLVDEYQDTNFAQSSIVWLLTKERRRVCVVGDDAQSIYSFRGANIDNILNFTNLYKGAKLIKLERNYRSTQMIVEAANSIISHNNHQIEKKVYSCNDEGEPLRVYAAYSDIEEAEIVVNKIVDYHLRKSVSYDNIAILYRTNAQSRIFEEALRKRSLPYRIYGGLSFYQRKEIKDFIAYCRLSVNPNDEEAFKRIINYPARGIGQTTLDKIINSATQHNVSLWDVACHPEEYELQVNKGTLTKIKGFTDLMTSFIEDAEKMDAAELAINIFVKSGIKADIFNDNSPEGQSRQENIQELLNGVKEFVDIRREEEDGQRILMVHFLQEISLLTDMDEDKGDDENKITLMTVHAAKGLEFAMVFVVGLEENLFPSQLSNGSIRELEEERRLFYVAVTRAEKYCFLTYSRSRFKYGKTEFSNPSRFLQEISKKCVVFDSGSLKTAANNALKSVGFNRITSSYDFDEPAVTHSVARVTGLKPMSRPVEQPVRHQNTTSSTTNLPSGNALVQKGQIIEHERFGIGQVIKVEGSGENTKATVKFNNTGTKQLLLKFARFKIVTMDNKLLGAIVGDIVGSTREWYNVKTEDFELLPEGSRFTDDTVMTLAVAEWLMTDSSHDEGKLIACMQRLGQQYPDAGYGGMFSQWLVSDHPEPYRSFGNGSAMRVSPVGLYAHTLDEALELARLTASVTHNHPEGIKGAQAVAACVFMSKKQTDKQEIKDYIERTFDYDLDITLEDIRQDYAFDVTCQGSVPIAIMAFLQRDHAEEALRLAISVGGDSDTIGCMTCAMADAQSVNSSKTGISQKVKTACRTLLTPDLLDINDRFYDFLLADKNA